MVENEEREFMDPDGPITFGSLKLLQLQITETLDMLKEVGLLFEQNRDERSRSAIQGLTDILLQLLAFEEEWLLAVNAEAMEMEDELIALISKL